MATEVKRAIRTATAWAENQSAMEAIYGVDGYHESLSEWLAAMQAEYPNLVTADVVLVAEGYADWPSGLPDYLDVTGLVVDAVRRPVVRAAPGEGHGGIPGAGFWVTASRNYNKVLGLYGFAHIDGIEAVNTGSVSSTGISLYGGATAERSLARGKTGFGFDGTSLMAVRTSRAYNCGTAGFGGTPYDVIKLENCIATACGVGFTASGTGANNVAKNCAAYGCTTSWAGTWHAGSTNNAASDGATNTPPGSTPYTSNVVSGDFVDAAGGDFHLSPTSGLIGQGDNLYSSFATDIDGDEWPSSGAWDIGVDYVAGAASSQDTAANDPAAQSDADTAPITQAHGLAANDAEGAAAADTAAASQAHALAADDAEATGAPDTAAVGSAADLAASDAESAADADAAAASQAHALAGTDIEAAGDPDAAAAGQAGTLAADDAQADADADTAAAGQVHALGAADIEAAANPDSAAAQQAGVLQPDNAEAQSEADSAAASQVHALGASDAEAHAAPDTGAVDGSATTAAADIEAQADADSAAITVIHKPVAADAEGQAAMDNAAAGQAHQLGASDAEAHGDIPAGGLLLDGIGVVFRPQLVDVTTRTYLIDPHNLKGAPR